jgi:hypothetical protein
MPFEWERGHSGWMSDYQIGGEPWAAVEYTASEPEGNPVWVVTRVSPFDRPLLEWEIAYQRMAFERLDAAEALTQLERLDREADMRPRAWALPSTAHFQVPLKLDHIKVSGTGIRLDEWFAVGAGTSDRTVAFLGKGELPLNIALQSAESVTALIEARHQRLRRLRPPRPNP